VIISEGATGFRFYRYFYDNSPPPGICWLNGICWTGPRHSLVERHLLNGAQIQGSYWKPNGKRICSISIYIFRRTLELDGLNFWEMIVTFFNFFTSFEVFFLCWRWTWRGSGETMWTFSPFRLQHTRAQTCKNKCTDLVRRLVCETVHHLVCYFLRYQNIFTVYEPIKKLHKCKLAEAFGNLFTFRGARRMCVCVSLCPCVTESMSWSAWKERC